MRHKQTECNRKKLCAADLPALALALCFILIISLFVASQTGTDFGSHCVVDSYTLQALAWREGRMTLSGQYPWLELAVYQDEYYVSFPPTPSVPMLLLSFFFGVATPNSLATFLYFLGGCAVAFFIARRYVPRAHAAVLIVFIALGGSLLDVVVSGGGYSGAVWYQAQSLSFLLTMLSFFWIESDRRSAHAASLIAIALAVGCRPLQALYVPFLLFMLYWRVKQQTVTRTIRAMLPYIVVPALIAAAYGAYNMARFDNPLEFGHRYLPEYTASGDTVFDFAKVWQNLRQIFQPPRIVDGLLTFSITGGFAVYLTNPMIPLGIVRFLEWGAQHWLHWGADGALHGDVNDAHNGEAMHSVCIDGKPSSMEAKPSASDYLLLATIIVHFASFLTHRTNGGWQYGTRYLVDVVPALLYLFVRAKKPIRLLEAAAMGGLVVFNVYGTIVFHGM